MDAQEILAVLIVVAVVGALLTRRRRATTGTCHDCASKPKATPGEAPLRFYRRNPDTKPGDSPSS